MANNFCPLIWKDLHDRLWWSIDGVEIGLQCIPKGSTMMWQCLVLDMAIHWEAHSDRKYFDFLMIWTICWDWEWSRTDFLGEFIFQYWSKDTFDQCSSFCPTHFELCCYCRIWEYLCESFIHTIHTCKWLVVFHNVICPCSLGNRCFQLSISAYSQ